MAELDRISGLGSTGGELRRMEFGDLVIEERLVGTIVQVNGASDPAALGRVASLAGLPEDGYHASMTNTGKGCTALWNGPGMWLLVLNEMRNSLVSELNDASEGTDISVTDLSQSRTVLRVTGKNTLDFMATGCPLDLEKCPPGSALSTQFGHFNVLVRLLDSTSADLYVYRSFGQALWDHCHHAGEEFR